MIPLGIALERIAGTLTRETIAFALIGGLAVSVRTEPRFTRDIDLAVAVANDAAAEALVHRLVGDGWTAGTLVEQAAVDRLATVRLGAPGDVTTSAVVDLLFASSGIEAEVIAGAEELEVLPGIVLPVASVAGLIVLKLLAAESTRPQDETDLAALFGVATPEDIGRSQQLASFVTERGFHRDRDLLGELERRRS